MSYAGCWLLGITILVVGFHLEGFVGMSFLVKVSVGSGKLVALKSVSQSNARLGDSTNLCGRDLTDQRGSNELRGTKMCPTVLFMVAVSPVSCFMETGFVQAVKPSARRSNHSAKQEVCFHQKSEYVCPSTVYLSAFHSHESKRTLDIG